MEAILATVMHKITNARVEAIKSKSKLSIRLAYGFQNIDRLIALIYLRCGRRMIKLPDRTPQTVF